MTPELALNYFPLTKYGFLYRLVTIDDAEFILNLRNHPTHAMHLSATSNQLEDQVEWIKRYKEREKQGIEFYIISIDAATNKKLGLNRVYNFNGNEYEIGSWLYEPGLEISASIIGDIVARNFAFDVLNFAACVFSVRKANKSVLRYHKGFKPEITKEDEKDVYFRLTVEDFKHHQSKLLKILGYE